VPNAIKLDVERFKAEVLAGAPRILASPRLQAVIIELNGARGRKYGRGDEECAKSCAKTAFRATYSPLERGLKPLGTRRPKNTVIDNESWFTNFDLVAERLRSAPVVMVLGRAD
jgi:hypothetical protein